MKNLRFFQVNSQTAIIIDSELSIIYASANHHTKYMVYNKPVISGSELNECKKLFKKHGFDIESELQTDSFSISFWNPALYKRSEFDTVMVNEMDSVK